MSRAAIVFQIARADFLERVRRYSFLLTLALTILFCYICIPPNHAAYVTFQIGDHRPLYNSAFVGALVGMQTTVLVSLGGFYLVKNAIDRDRSTRVGQILAATRLSKSLYLLGKALSNFAVLASMAAAIALAAVFMQLARGEDRTIHIWSLWAPFALIVLPLMATVAGLAVLFETVPWLSGGLGNVVYFLVWVAGISSGASSRTAGNRWFLNPTGFDVLIPNMVAACASVFAGCAASKGVALGFTSAPHSGLTTFRWEGVHWTPEILIVRVSFVLLGLAVTVLATLFFDRFDHSREQQSERGTPVMEERPLNVKPAQAFALTPVRKRFRFGAMVRAELRIALQGLEWWWYAVAGACVIGGLLSPSAISRIWLIAAWIWPILIWSAMGTRESRYRTSQLVFSTAHPIARQLAACWTAGLVVAALAGSGTAVRLLIAGDYPFILSWLVGVLFIPTLAVFAGAWSGSSKLFEVTYTLLWYLGPVNRAPSLDFIRGNGVALEFFAASVALGIAAIIGRRRSIRV